jgi:hypothetical protein
MNKDYPLSDIIAYERNNRNTTVYEYPNSAYTNPLLAYNNPRAACRYYYDGRRWRIYWLKEGSNY